MKKNIKFYLVPASPWTFLSFSRIEKVSTAYNLEVDLIPINIFKLFEMQEIKTVAKRPVAIQKNRLRELQRWKEYLDINFNIKPKFFPVDPIKSCKLIIASSILYPNEKNRSFQLAKKLSEAVWVDELNIDDETVIFEIVEEIVDIKKLKNLYFHKEVESILQKNTLDAFDNDIFGVPTFVYEDKIFWGQDRIFFLEKEIKKSDE